MNGAAVNCQQEQALHPQHNDSSSVHSPGYLHQTNYSCQENNSQHQYSKAMNYKLLPDNFSVGDSSRHSQYIECYGSEPRNRLSNSGDIWNNRINPTRIIREPMELPVPNFEIDENSVGVFTYKKDKSSLVQDSKDLDLDTRIDLLIKSKALSGMHPIFSDLNESEDSSTDSEETYSDLSKCKPSRHEKISLPEKNVIHQESFDDPEKPLSRPPSPFLSRATYLFWFNKAIELKQQAKAQEQALLEKATKKLNRGNSSTGKVNKTANSKPDKDLLKTLLSEVSKELKESIKQDFIKEIIEKTVLNSLEDWWVKERKFEDDNCSKDWSIVSSTTNDNLESKDWSKISEPKVFQAKIDNKVTQGQRSTDSKVIFPSSEDQKSKGKPNILEIQATSNIELNKIVVKDSNPNILEDSTVKHESVLSKENDYLRTTKFNESCTNDGFPFKDSNFLNCEEMRKNDSLNVANDTLFLRFTTNDEICIDKPSGNLQQDGKKVSNVPVNNEESNNHQHSLIDNPKFPGTSVVKSLKENILVDIEQGESSENSVIGTVKALDTLENLEESRVSSKDSSIENEKKEECFLQDQINNKENNSETKQNMNQ